MSLKVINLRDATIRTSEQHTTHLHTDSTPDELLLFFGNYDEARLLGANNVDMS